jgi:hypothetical protein
MYDVCKPVVMVGKWHYQKRKGKAVFHRGEFIGEFAVELKSFPESLNEVSRKIEDSIHHCKISCSQQKGEEKMLWFCWFGEGLYSFSSNLPKTVSVITKVLKKQGITFTNLEIKSLVDYIKGR